VTQSRGSEKAFIVPILLVAILGFALYLGFGLFGTGGGGGGSGEDGGGELEQQAAQPKQSLAPGAVIVSGKKYLILDTEFSTNQTGQLVEFVKQKGWKELKLNCKNDATAHAEVQLKTALQESGLKIVGNCFQNL
jgi:hypothetical protein